MRTIRAALSLLLLSLTVSSNAWALGVLEVPSAGSTVSGVLFASGWKCPRQGEITVIFDDHAPLPAAVDLARGDTAGVCANDGRNGYLAQFNYGLLGDGEHTAVVLDDGVEFDRATFFVTTLGTSFLLGASGAYRLDDFPRADESVVVEWSQGLQNFVIVEHDAVPPGACPTDGPIQDLTDDCSDWIYFYRRNALLADLITDGTNMAICTIGTSGDILCYGGVVTSPVDFGLRIVNLNGGPFFPLDAGSGGTLAGGGETLNFTIVLEGEAFVFSGLEFIDVEPASADAAARSAQQSSESGLVALLRSSAIATSAAQHGRIASSRASDADLAILREALGAFESDASAE